MQEESQVDLTQYEALVHRKNIREPRMRGEMPVYASDPLRTTPYGPYGAPTCTVRGDGHGQLFHPNDYSLWRVVGEFESGAELEWSTEHGDEALYVLQGALEIGNTSAEQGTTVIIEAGVPVTIGIQRHTSVVHFGPISAEPPSGGILGAPTTEGRTVHIVTTEQARRLESPKRVGGGTIFSDGTCLSCRIALSLIDGETPGGYSEQSHSHSEDELIHVLEGVVHVGRLVLEPGMSIAIPKNVRYGFRTEGSYRFLNYRRDVASYVGSPGSEPMVETVSAITESRQGT
jgi:quercetin dioxygenase-like cupin family protein